MIITYGTRPEYIKIKPLLAEMARRNMPFKTLFTGQHQDIAPKTADFVIDIKNYGDNRLDNIIQNCMNLPDHWFKDVRYVLVQGDTTSVVGIALAALHRKIKVIHLEAGLRTYDNGNPYPEENNRKIVSTLASIHLCPTESNKSNLLKENITSEIFVVGNTALDNLLPYKGLACYGNKILVTMHRRENHDMIDQWFAAINNLAIAYPDFEFILPLHPNPNVRQHKGLLSAVKVVEPLSHDELLKVLLNTKLVITDSGGIQEECSFLNKKCLVCRKVTERPESVGISSFLVSSPTELDCLFKYHSEQYKLDIESPYGDGKSAIRICDIFRSI